MTTAIDDARWVTILDGFAAVHGTDIAWVCRRIGMHHAQMSRARSGKPGYHVTPKYQHAIADLFLVPPRLIWGPWDHWPWDATMARLHAVVDERGIEMPWLKRKILERSAVSNNDLVGPVDCWSQGARAGVSRFLWVPVEAIWHKVEASTVNVQL